MFFKNKIIWITGASSGIGEQLAYESVKRGARVIISSRNKNKLETIKEQCRKLGGDCTVVPFDLSSTEQINQAADQVIDSFERIDILINNGGISQRSKMIETQFDVEKKIMETNFFGTVALTKRVLPLMIRSGGGHIAVTSSLAGLFGVKFRSSYAASKHALNGYFETLGIELQKKNIKVTVVCPGFVNTSISLNALEKDGSQHNKMDKGQKRGMSAQKCSVQYLNAIKKHKKIALIGGNELVMVYLKRFVPSLFYKISRKINPV